MRFSRRLTGALAGGIAALLMVGQPTSAQPATPASPFEHGGSAPQSVTLITGDRVTLFAGGRVAIEPRPGIRFASYATGSHRYVIPSDAFALLKAGRLDRRLFDVNELLAVAHSAPRLDGLPVIVSGAASAPGLSVGRKLPAVKGFSAHVGRGRLASTWQALRSRLTVGKVWLDAVRTPSLDVSVPLIGAPTAWAAGYDGTGVTVAVLDTGIDATHPDLAGKIAHEQNFTEGVEDNLDHVGHGTHVATTIAGSGAASAGKYRGVAPGATLLDGKVCVDGGCAESWILAGMQWAAQSGAKVANMSLGGFNGPEIDPLEQAVNDLTAQYGTLFVIAAGNEGADETVSSPASAEAALAVAAFDKTDELADFSSRGPSADGYAVKPEIAAPGVDIVAGRSKDGLLGEPGELYMPLSGTSMATPHVVGSAAILTQVHPGWSPAQIKAALMAAAKPNPSVGVFAQGAGRVDIGRAITQSVVTTPVAVSLGLQEWPHEDDAADTRGIAYHNYGTSAVTLDLGLTTTAPAGIFSLSASTLTVPAGGDASVTLTADTRNGGSAVGYLGGQVTATAPGISVQTPFGVVREEQVFPVHLGAIQRDGAAADGAALVLQNKATGRNWWLDGSSADLRLPAGDYFAFSWISEGSGPETWKTTQIVAPQVVVGGGPLTVTFDARTAGAFDVTVPQPGAQSLSAIIAVDYSWDGGGYSVATLGDRFDTIFAGQLGPAEIPALTSNVTGVFVRMNAAGDFLDTPYVYNVGWYAKGHVIRDLVKHLHRSDIGSADATFAKLRDGAVGERINYLMPPDAPGGWGVAWDRQLPFQRTDYFAGNAPWVTEFMELMPTDDGWPEIVADNSQEPTAYAPGTATTEKWNTAVFGPSTKKVWGQFYGPVRWRDSIFGDVGMLGDGYGRAGNGPFTSGRGALYREGVLVAENDGPWVEAEVDPATAAYRLEVSLERDARISTRVSGVWGFTSGHVGEEAVPLPLTTVSFAPAVDDRNLIHPGGVAVIPITVNRPPTAGQLASLTVEVSFDDGVTWQVVPVIQIGGFRRIMVAQPAGAGFVSLRASGVDTDGNTFQETIIRAYEMR